MRLPFVLSSLLVLTSLLATAGAQELPPEILQRMQAQGVVIEGMPAGATPAAAPEKPSERLQKFQQLKFDRRPSVVLKAWASPELKPLDEDDSEEVAKLRQEIADLEKEVAANAEKAKAAAEAAKKAAEDAAAAAKKEAERKAAEQKAADQKAQAEAEKTEPEKAEAGKTEGDETEGEQTETQEESAEAQAPPKTAEAAGATDQPQIPPSPAAAPAPAVPPAADPKAAELAAKKAAYEAKKLQREFDIFGRDVTLGRWDRVAQFVAGFGEKEGPIVYEHLLRTLPNAPVQQQNNRGVPPDLFEKNTFSLTDVRDLSAAAPAGLEAKKRKELIGALAPLAQRALAAGHATEELLSILRAEAGKEKGAFSRREAALLLVALGRDADLADFVPTLAEATGKNDREGLNLLSRLHLAEYAKEKKTAFLEQAWQVTQAALADGEVEEAEKTEALRRAVELAPKIRDELGEAWLVESFTDRPERGMEILATIGAQASKAFETHPSDADYRLKGLQLQKTAVDALLGKAPERAESWRESLSLLAANWLAEAIYSYGNSEATSMGPIIRRDSYGNIYYTSYRGNYRGPVSAIEPGELLEIRPEGRWVELLDSGVRPRFATVAAELFLKVSEEVKAFPYIEALAATHPQKAKELAEEFLRVWARNHNPNVANNQTDPYMFIYGFDQRSAGIPLTRSKQERNLRDLAQWVAKLRQLPIPEIDQKLVVSAFTSSHSVAEVYRLETIESVFGSLDQLEPKTIAEMAQKMRTNLAEVWRDPNTQKQNKTNRKQKDIEREVLGGYRTARQVIEGAMAKYPDDWRLVAAEAALAHDENNYRQEVAKSAEFAGNRKAALDHLAHAAELYARDVESLSLDEETAEPFELWFYAALGACDLRFVDERQTLAAAEPARIKAALAALPGEASERHQSKFANLLFTRMSAVNPAVKVRYLRAGFDIVGDHPQALEARKVFDYYNDLVSEIKLAAIVDGDDTVGYDKAFGLRIELHHTREIERESGGFAKYLQNQNNVMYAYNYGRPLENYRDKFQEAATQALQEHFEVLSMTFAPEDVNSKASEEYGWRVTPYAYALLKARGPEVDKIPELRIDLDFLDTSGYAVIPVASAAVPIDASKPATPRPYHDLEVTQILDERQADSGKLVLEVKASAKGLVPDFEQIIDFAPAEFDVAKKEDQGVAVSRFDDEQRDVVSERLWLLTLTAKEGLPKAATTFAFPKVNVDANVIHQRYADADLIAAEPVVTLGERLGEPSARWPWFVGLGLLVAVLSVFLWSRARARPAAVSTGRHLPKSLTPFTVLGLLRDIERDPKLGEQDKRDLGVTIAAIERHFFGPADDVAPDLQRIAEDWLRRVG